MFACQKDSYCQKIETTVLTCDLIDSSKCKYAVVLEDTVLFPEGGGQPSDSGHINGIAIDDVKRSGNKAIHYTQQPFTVGETVSVIVNWQKRFDHMQQHTGQHLITALAEDLYKFATTSWNLGDTVCFIELDVPSINCEELDSLEQKVNEKIRDCIPVFVNYYAKDSTELSHVRTRLELPDDHDGLVRVVTIDGIDSNTCCGTHVKNTSELQVIKFLFAEKGKKNKTNLHFIVGNRVLQYMSGCVSREKKINSLLGCKSEELIDRVQKLQNSLKTTRKGSLLILKDLANLEVKLFKLIIPRPKYYFLHKKNVEPDFITYFLSEVKDCDTLFFLTVEVGKSDGQFALIGSENIVQELGPKICDTLDAKGSGKQGKFQGKFKKSSAIKAVEDLIALAFNFEQHLSLKNS